MSRRHLAALSRPWDWWFDGGSAASIADDTGKIRITPRFRWDGNWQYWAMRSDRMGGKTPHFLIAKANKLFGVGASETLAFWSTGLESDVWSAFDNQSEGASDIEFYNNGPFPNGMIYIANAQPYPFSRSMNKYLEWKRQDSRITLINMGQETRRSNGDGRIAPALPFWGFSITNPSGFTKNNMIVSCRNHTAETPNGFALEGLMTWLMGGSAEAEFLLDWFNVFVYPCINPQGAWGGWSGCNAEITNTQHNDTTAGFDDLDAYVARMNTDTGGDIEVGIDLHGYGGAGTSLAYVEDAAAAINLAYEAAYQAYDASFNLLEDASAVILTKYWSDTFSAALSMNIEQCMFSGRTIAQHKTAGQYTGLSVARLHAEGRFTNGPGVGSRDFNGTTDRLDRASVLDTAGQALTVSAWLNLDAYIANPLTAYIWMSHRTGDAAYGAVFATTWSGRLVFFRNGSTGLARYTDVTNLVGTGALVHVMFTHTGLMTDYTTINLYINNVDRSSNTDAANGAGEFAAAGKWSIGGRFYDDARNTNGKISHVRVFTRVLNSAERALEAAGILTTTSGLVSWFKGNTASLNDAVDAVAWTADGTAQLTGVGNGPAIVYP